MIPRRSAISVILFCLRVAHEDVLVLLRHQKWGDWGLVGGHIEDGEDPLTCAAREAEEELAPLRVDVDMALEALGRSPIEWGPVYSRSARSPTVYQAWFYSGRFLADPRFSLRRVRDRSMGLVLVSRLNPTSWPEDITNVLARFWEQHGSSAMPLSWPHPLNPVELGVPVIGAHTPICCAT